MFEGLKGVPLEGGPCGPFGGPFIIRTGGPIAGRNCCEAIAGGPLGILMGLTCGFVGILAGTNDGMDCDGGSWPLGGPKVDMFTSIFDDVTHFTAQQSYVQLLKNLLYEFSRMRNLDTCPYPNLSNM